MGGCCWLVSGRFQLGWRGITSQTHGSAYDRRLRYCFVIEETTPKRQEAGHTVKLYWHVQCTFIREGYSWDLADEGTKLPWLWSKRITDLATRSIYASIGRFLRESYKVVLRKLSRNQLLQRCSYVRDPRHRFSPVPVSPLLCPCQNILGADNRSGVLGCGSEGNGAMVQVAEQGLGLWRYYQPGLEDCTRHTIAGTKCRFRRMSKGQYKSRALEVD